MRKALFILMQAVLSAGILAQSTVIVNPTARYQRIEGWGGSLCWWANVAGGWSDEKITDICTWITDPNGLNMNSFRFNIGGGENPAHLHFRSDAYMQGYKKSESSGYDWSQDRNQRKILLKLDSLRNDALFEAFSNSPPYWMTESKCSAGNTGGSNNLSDDYYDDFADYLTEVVKYYKDSLGIIFNTLEPFNEPFSGWWTEGNNQEGCSFNQSNQAKMIRELYQKLSDKNMLDYCTISAMDASSLDECVDGVKGYVSAGDIMSKISQINTHSYSGSKRTELYSLAKSSEKRLWQSESGPLGISGSGITLQLLMAQRIITDLRDLKPVVWLDWQLMDQGSDWGAIQADYSNQTYFRNKFYYTRMQCSRFIKQGYIIIQTSNECTVGAISPDFKELVFIVANESLSEENYSFDLGMFNEIIDSAQAYRTSQTENCTRLPDIAILNKNLKYKAPVQSLTTFIIPVVIDSCTPTRLIPYIQVNDLEIQQTSNAKIDIGKVKLWLQDINEGSWSWSGPNGINDSTNEITVGNIQSIDAGNYIASYIDTNGCVSKNVFNLSVLGHCAISEITPYVQINDGNWQQSTNANVDPGAKVKFGPQPIAEGKWNWKGPNGFDAISREITINNIQPQHTGEYVATYKGDRCISTTIFNLNLIAHTFIENEYKDLPGSLNGISCEVYPNPVAEILNIRIENELNGSVGMKLFNSVGEPIHNVNTHERIYHLDTKNLKSGVYIMKIYTEKQTIIRKVLKI
jgi:O-glycosyl hydrolase